MLIKFTIFVKGVMKIKLNFLLLFLLTVNIVLAQKKDLRLDIGFQRNLRENKFNQSLSNYDNRGNGFGFHISPRWNYSKNVSFGVCMDVNTAWGYFSKPFTDNVEARWAKSSVSPYTIFSFSPSVTYYFTETKLKPFIGISVGAYYFLYHTPIVNPGIRPSIGISLNKTINLSMEYSRVFGKVKSSEFYYYENVYHFNKNIISFKVSFSIGLMKSNHNR